MFPVQTSPIQRSLLILLLLFFFPLLTGVLSTLGAVHDTKGLYSDASSYREPPLTATISHQGARTHHQLCTALQLQGLGCLLLQVQQLLLP